MKSLLCLFCVLLLANAAPCGNETQVQRNKIHETIENGFILETHQVVTSDGYILKLFRVPYKMNESSGIEDRPVVFLMHGLFGMSQHFLGMGPEYSIGYHLAEAGFDVWMGNARGNVNSRAHVTLDPDSDADHVTFFNFSWEEIGMIDLPTMIDYSLEYTGQQKLHYIGHSQGGTVFLVLGSMIPEYNEKMASVHLLAGVGYQDYFPNEQLKSTAQLTDLIYTIALMQGLVEVTPDLLAELPPIGYTRSDMCFGDPSYKFMCDLIGINHLRNDTADITFGGGAIKQVAHYGQNIRDQLFRRYHYGNDNQNVYGTANPPLYDLGLITSNVTMHYTVNDNLLDERDVLAMAADMPNTAVRKVARDTFEHGDFIAATDAKELVTDYIISFINEVHYAPAAPAEPDEVLTTEAPLTPVQPSAATNIFLSNILSLLVIVSLYYR